MTKKKRNTGLFSHSPMLPKPAPGQPQLTANTSLHCLPSTPTSTYVSGKPCTNDKGRIKETSKLMKKKTEKALWVFLMQWLLRNVASSWRKPHQNGPKSKPYNKKLTDCKEFEILAFNYSSMSIMKYSCTH